jgi:hypothetical protein
MKHAHKRQVAIALGKIKSVAHHENVGNCKPDVIRADGQDSARRLIQKNADSDLAGAGPFELAQHFMNRIARIQDIVDQQDVSSPYVQA